jgi:hypothetical protein
MARKRKIFAPSEDDITAAEWRSVEGFPAYEVSNGGLVRNETGLLLKPEVGHRGHLRVTLYNESGPQRHLVHRLVLLHFVGPAPSEEHECAHWDGDPANNQVGNLRWATPKENTEDARRHGRLIVGEKCHFSKLDEDQATEIRKRVACGSSTGALADELGLDLGTVNRIVCGKSWKHLSGPIRQSRARRPVDESTVAQAIRSVAEGLSVSEAARQFGCSRQSINRRRYNPPEKLIHAAVIEHWTKLGLPSTLVATLPNAHAHGQPGLTPGLADLVALAPDLPVGFIELKRDYDSPISDEQRDFGKLCVQLGIPFMVAVGRDEPIRLLEDWRVVRRATA